MLILVVGGAYQGKFEFAQTFGLPILNNLQDMIKEQMNRGNFVQEEMMKLVEKESCVVVCNEIGCGIIPIKKEDRDYREAVGRVACAIAKKADAVYKVEASIAQKIKG